MGTPNGEWSNTCSKIQRRLFHKKYATEKQKSSMLEEENSEVVITLLTVFSFRRR